MEQQKREYGSGNVLLESKSARLEVVCMGMHYAFDLILWGDGEVGVRCITKNHFQYATNQEGLDILCVDKLNDIFNEPLIIHEKTALFLDDDMLKGRIAILITNIRDYGGAKRVAYQYKWSQYLQR